MAFEYILGVWEEGGEREWRRCVLSNGPLKMLLSPVSVCVCLH